MSIEENKAVVTRFIDGFNRHDSIVLRDVLSPELAEMFIERGIPANSAKWSDHRGDIIDMLGEGDKVWVHLATSGRHTGDWPGHGPATGKKWANRGLMFMRLAAGKIVEFDGLWETYKIEE